MLQFNREKFDEIVARGLCIGTGDPAKQVCIEVAVALACGEEPTDSPTCVHGVLRGFAIRLNDSNRWASPQSRAGGLRGFAIAQLGSASWPREDMLRWVQVVTLRTVREVLPIALRAAKLNEHATACEGAADLAQAKKAARAYRSEERRVGKECRSRWSPYH
jgi:hypothetical protein